MHFLQFIVLAGIMAIWALTSLLSREAQPLPPRPKRDPGPGGMRPPAPPYGRAATVEPGRYAGTADRFGASMPERPPSARWPESSGPPRPAAPGGLAHDGIVILDPDMRRSQPSAGGPSSAPSAMAPRNQRGGQTRRGSRSRPPSNAIQTKPAEPGRQRALSSLVTQSMSQQKNRPLELTPLDSPLAPLGAPLTQLATSALREQPRSWDVPAAFDGAALRAMLASTNKLRQVALLNEILQPPLALRRPRRFHQ